MDTVPGQLYGFHSLKVLNLGKLHDANPLDLAGQVMCQFCQSTLAQAPQLRLHMFIKKNICKQYTNCYFTLPVFSGIVSNQLGRVLSLGLDLCWDSTTT